MATWIKCEGLPLESTAGPVMAARKRIPDLLEILRSTGRQFQSGKEINLRGLQAMIDAKRDHQPVLCAELTDLINAASEEIGRGNAALALRHLRAAIGVARDAKYRR
jgi:hypothetical protein